MKKFTEWQLQKEFAEVGGINDLAGREVIKRRVQQLFEDLEKANIPRQKAIQLLAIILREFEQEFALGNSHMRQAWKMASAPNEIN